MRLQKYMAHAGVASRRKSEEIISKRRVTVNGRLETNPAYHVQEDDIVEVDGREISIDRYDDYFILNKPIDVVSTASDEEDRNTVIDMINTHKRIYPVGRLDMDTEGLILLTNDGDLTNIMTHPRYEIPKTYIARVTGNPTEKELNLLRDGITIDGYKTSKASIQKLRSSNRAVISITISEGRNRQVRRMFEHIGYEIENLQRTQFGEFYLGSLKPGEYRKLSNREKEYVQELKSKYK